MLSDKVLARIDHILNSVGVPATEGEGADTVELMSHERVHLLSHRLNQLSFDVTVLSKVRDELGKDMDPAALEELVQRIIKEIQAENGEQRAEPVPEAPAETTEA